MPAHRAGYSFSSTTESCSHQYYINKCSPTSSSVKKPVVLLHSFQIVVVGDHNCGKSCILLRFAENAFRSDHISTLGVDFKLKTIKLGRDKIRLELWDTAGMERYRTIYNSYYHSAHGVVCVYDMTSEKSFDNLENYWLKEIKQHAPQNAVLMLIGNKADLETERKVSTCILCVLYACNIWRK
ncbi:unnamed protein product [Heligmosomoides polygyrus]|uniref:Uncharacterized protein n=1 Tax=Heligmosomoides polygyrus TaxID=6339 RepID=A0A3P8B8J7_HELPZ|nr:unnamed protein product [Heligmosomoides polygyrus]